MNRSAEDELFALLEDAGVAAALRAPLSRYGALVLEAGRRVNLTGAKSPGALADHLLDSLMVVPHVREPLVDVGSGAGFPGIPIAIAAGIPVTLIETTAKKAAFLAKALEELNLPGDVIARRAEDAGRDDTLRERFASGTARALSGATTVAELLLPLIAPGGVAILQRGRLDARERGAVEDAALMLGGRLESELPLEGERRILLLRKERATPARFPRRPGVPEKRPLCMEALVSRRTPR
ncbi:MAG: 16S rRNA (guanine(527)-N(7))-methyltransferase RsmG [Candidatus Eremiobacteraeota bacterium]|nr:16S rRNA (guanine(527)-N(7))-methyltransferase RsmG [Candidatus Eremiobacteraeota bacterium]